MESFGNQSGKEYLACLNVQMIDVIGMQRRFSVRRPEHHVDHKYIHSNLVAKFKEFSFQWSIRRRLVMNK